MVNERNEHLWKEAVNIELYSLDRVGTWNVVDKIAGEKELDSTWGLR
jgi:hypothetical protein